MSSKYTQVKFEDQESKIYLQDSGHEFYPMEGASYNVTAQRSI